MRAEFKAVAATTNIDLQKDRFTVEALEQLADTAIGKPILLGFNIDKPVGFIRKAKVIDKKLHIIFSIDGPITKSYCVPGIILEYGDYDPEADIFTLKKCRSISFGLTDTPCDTTITPIEIM